MHVLSAVLGAGAGAGAGGATTGVGAALWCKCVSLAHTHWTYAAWTEAQCLITVLFACKGASAYAGVTAAAGATAGVGV